MSVVEFEDVSDLCAMVDAAKTTLQLPSTATNAEVYHKGFEVVLQHITTTFSHNTTKAQYLRLAVLQDINITEKENEATYHLAHRVGASYLMHGKVKRAETILLLALSGLNKLHGDATDVHPEVLKVCGTLTTVYERSGDYKKAIAMASRVLKAQEAQLGPKHRETLSSVTNVAGLLLHVGDVQQSEDLYQRALVDLAQVVQQEQDDGPTNNKPGKTVGTGKEQKGVELDLDLDYLTCLGNYAILLEKKPDPDSQELALSYYKRALRGKETLLGKKNPDTLRSLSNLAMLLESQGSVEEAQVMLTDCLQQRTEALGKDHSETLSSRAAVAGCLLKKGQHKQACQEYQTVLTGYVTTLGPSSPMSIQAVSDLAYSLMANEQMEDALSMYKKATALRLQKYGGSHPSTLKSFFDTGLVLVQVGQCKEAVQMLKAAEKGYADIGGREALREKCVGIIGFLEETQKEGEGEEGGEGGEEV